MAVFILCDSTSSFLFMCHKYNT